MGVCADHLKGWETPPRDTRGAQPRLDEPGELVDWRHKPRHDRDLTLRNLLSWEGVEAPSPELSQAIRQGHGRKT